MAERVTIKPTENPAKLSRNNKSMEQLVEVEGHQMWGNSAL